MRSSWYNKLSMIFGPKSPPSWLILSIISVLALISLLSSSSSNAIDSKSRRPVSLIYTNYRRIKEQAAVDYLELRSLSISGGTRQKELGLCGKERENFVPCHNVSANSLAGLQLGEEFDRHCELLMRAERCLIRPPKEYKIPLRWPSGRDVIWSGNVKITKDQFLSSGSMTKRLMLLEENQIAFHSEDGLIFDGVKDYSRQLAEMIGLGSDTEFPQAGVSLPYIFHNGMFLLEVNRVLKPGGYFVLTSPTSRSQGSSSRGKKKTPMNPIEELTQQLCWTLLAQQDETFIWQKTSNVDCYASRKQQTIQLCKEGDDGQSYYHPLVPCISGTSSKRVEPEEFYEDLQYWRSAVNNYWSLLTPLIFSDHPKRPGDEDPLPPFNMIRNVMDMNANYGGLNAALLEEKKSVWVMNVVPARTFNVLPLILDRGFAGAMHDWCEPFPTYPRTYDMLHANGLLSLLTSERCSMIDLFVEMDRILRPEGWVILSDKMGAIEMARTFAAQVRWEARVIDLQNGSDQRLLVCQKPFVKK
ncbi:unnamed protein product [Lupinus luteus]|uniref:Methyltransferase n=1 Tax=Lupinus luteus TaxID=3873 RepID=A0AAV1WSV5_LUPLU